MRASSPLQPVDAPAAQPDATASSYLASLSSDWHWEDMEDMDLGSLDQFLTATADDFLEPFADAPDSPLFADADLFYREHDLAALHAAEVGAQLDSLLECRAEAEKSEQRHRKRKTAELHRLRGEADRLAGQNLHLEKRIRMTQMQQHTAQSARDVAAMKSEMEVNEQAEKLFRRRYDILHGILEAWNTGGIEDLEEIADNVYDDDVTLISPDYSNGLHGVKAVMSHWNTLLDAFPDGIMEEYTIQREEGEKITASWTFSGTQIFPIHGVPPRHKKVCISGKSFFWFNGDKIRQVVLSWNYRETLMKLMGVQPDKSTGIMLTTPHCATTSNPVALTSTADSRP